MFHILSHECLSNIMLSVSALTGERFFTLVAHVVQFVPHIIALHYRASFP